MTPQEIRDPLQENHYLIEVIKNQQVKQDNFSNEHTLGMTTKDQLAHEILQTCWDEKKVKKVVGKSELHEMLTSRQNLVSHRTENNMADEEKIIMLKSEEDSDDE